MKASEDITNDMVGILASFEQRLKRLEGTILPVYQVCMRGMESIAPQQLIATFASHAKETENLQRRQENIDRTTEAMDHVIAFYNVSKEVEPTVAQVRGLKNSITITIILTDMVVVCKELLLTLI